MLIWISNKEVPLMLSLSSKRRTMTSSVPHQPSIKTARCCTCNLSSSLVSLIPLNPNNFDWASVSQRSRLCPRLHRQSGVLHFVCDKKHPAHLRKHLSIGQVAISRGPARRSRRLSRSPTAGSYLRNTQFWFFVRYRQGSSRPFELVCLRWW